MSGCAICVVGLIGLVGMMASWRWSKFMVDEPSPLVKRDRVLRDKAHEVWVALDARSKVIPVLCLGGRKRWRMR